MLLEMNVNESVLLNQKDIYYNKEKFDSGEINLCFITGHSGSGKSTMGRDMQKNNIEHYELDDLQCVADHFTMDNLKDYGGLIYSYFNGPGKEFYKTHKWLIENNATPENYEAKLFPGFVHYAMKYAKSHKNKKFVLEGVWLYAGHSNSQSYFEPSEFKDYAFYIKGTSILISKIRAAKRDAKNISSGDKMNNMEFMRQMKNNWKWYFIDESKIKKFRDYFSKLISVNESVDYSKADTNYLSRGTLKNIKYIDFKESQKSTKYNFLKNHPLFKNERLKKSSDGCFAIDIDKEKVVGTVFVNHSSNKNTIGLLKVDEKYRGYGIGKELMKKAISLGGDTLGVFTDNEIGIKLYKSLGFKVSENKKDKNGSSFYIMKLNKLNKNNKVITERSFIKMHDSLYTLLNEFNDSGISEIPLIINYSEDILPENEKNYINQRVSKFARIIASPKKEINVSFISASDFYDRFQNKYIFGTYDHNDDIIYMIYPEEVPEEINYSNLCIHEFSHAVLYAVNPNLSENDTDGIVITWADGHLDDLKNLASITGDDKYYSNYVNSIASVKEQISQHGESILYDIARENITEGVFNKEEKNNVKMIEMNKPKESGFKKIQNKALDANVKFKRKLSEGKKKSQDAKNAGKAVAKIPMSVKDMVTDTVNKWDEADDDRRKEYILKPGFRKKYWKALKLAIVHYGAFAINPILNIVLLICHKLSNSKDARIRNEMIRELKAEIKVTDEKIEDAKFDRDKSAKYKLMRIREKLVAELDRVTANSKFI